jgi:hypothetical protein
MPPSSRSTEILLVLHAASEARRVTDFPYIRLFKGRSPSHAAPYLRLVWAPTSTVFRSAEVFPMLCQPGPRRRISDAKTTRQGGNHSARGPRQGLPWLWWADVPTDSAGRWYGEERRDFCPLQPLPTSESVRAGPGKDLVDVSAFERVVHESSDMGLDKREACASTASAI